MVTKLQKKNAWSHEMDDEVPALFQLELTDTKILNIGSFRQDQTYLNTDLGSKQPRTAK